MLDGFIVFFFFKSLLLSSAEVQENGGDDLLLSEEFLRNCAEMLSVSPKGSEMNSRAFTQKHLNIIDPLKENNNLGRSVNRGMILLASIVMLLEYVQVCF